MFNWEKLHVDNLFSESFHTSRNTVFLGQGPGARGSGPLHTQDWRPMTIAIYELSLVARAETHRPSSLHTRRWRPKSPKKTLWMKNVHRVLHGGLWIRFHGLPEFLSGLPPRSGPHTNFVRPLLFLLFFQRDTFRYKFQDKFQDSQILSNW